MSIIPSDSRAWADQRLALDESIQAVGFSIVPK